MTPNSIDDLLREHAHRWTQSQAAPPSLEQALSRAIQPQRSRHTLLAVAACILAVALVAALAYAASLRDRPSASGSAPPSSQQTDTAAALWQLARINAAALGDDHITADAVHTSNGTWLIQARGSFTCGPTCFNLGNPAPHGTVLILTVDAATLQVSAMSITGQPRDLSQLGTVIPLGS